MDSLVFTKKTLFSELKNPESLGGIKFENEYIIFPNKNVYLKWLKTIGFSNFHYESDIGFVLNNIKTINNLAKKNINLNDIIKIPIDMLDKLFNFK